MPKIFKDKNDNVLYTGYETSEVVANPTLAGTEADLTGVQIGSTKYKVPQGGAAYNAGDGITITNNTISVDFNDVQEKLTAGSNITIENGVISATSNPSNVVQQINYPWDEDVPFGHYNWIRQSVGFTFVGYVQTARIPDCSHDTYALSTVTEKTVDGNNTIMKIDSLVNTEVGFGIVHFTLTMTTSGGSFVSCTSTYEAINGSSPSPSAASVSNLYMFNDIIAVRDFTSCGPMAYISGEDMASLLRKYYNQEAVLSDYTSDYTNIKISLEDLTDYSRSYYNNIIDFAVNVGGSSYGQRQVTVTYGSDSQNLMISESEYSGPSDLTVNFVANILSQLQDRIHYPMSAMTLPPTDITAFVIWVDTSSGYCGAYDGKLQRTIPLDDILNNFEFE